MCLSGWFSQGPLAEMGPLYGWGEYPIAPGSGPVLALLSSDLPCFGVS